MYSVTVLQVLVRAVPLRSDASSQQDKICRIRRGAIWRRMLGAKLTAVEGSS
jgi:hypothetical protein